MDTTIQVSTKALQVIKLVKDAVSNSLTGVSFFSIKNYEKKCDNDTIEISDNLINVGINYEKSKQDDIKFLRNLDVTTLKGYKSSVMDLFKAQTALILAFEKPNENRSKGQTDAFTTIFSGIKAHNETGQLYIYGYRVSKTVKQEGTYKTVKSSTLTIAKNELRKLLKTGKFKQFVVSNADTLKANGETIEL